MPSARQRFSKLTPSPYRVKTPTKIITSGENAPLSGTRKLNSTPESTMRFINTRHITCISIDRAVGIGRVNPCVRGQIDRCSQGEHRRNQK